MRRTAWLLPVALAACDAGPQPPWSEPPSLAVDLRIAVAPAEVELLQPLTVTIDRYRKHGRFTPSGQLL